MTFFPVIRYGCYACRGRGCALLFHDRVWYPHWCNFFPLKRSLCLRHRGVDWMYREWGTIIFLHLRKEEVFELYLPKICVYRLWTWKAAWLVWSLWSVAKCVRVGERRKPSGSLGSCPFWVLPRTSPLKATMSRIKETRHVAQEAS